MNEELTLFKGTKAFEQVGLEELAKIVAHENKSNEVLETENYLLVIGPEHRPIDDNWDGFYNTIYAKKVEGWDEWSWKYFYELVINYRYKFGVKEGFNQAIKELKRIRDNK